jgi:hypothetical protein
MMKFFEIFNLDPNRKYFPDKDAVKKKAITYYGIFLFIAIAMSSFTLLGFLILILFIFATCGFLTVEYYSDELDEKYGLYNYSNFRGFSLQIFSFILLGLSTTSLSVLLMCLCAGATVIKAILLAVIFALPFLGIGLNFRTFNDSSLEENGEKVYDAGYEPNYYFIVLAICCYLGYTQGLYETSIINILGLLISTTACFIWLIFPDKINKYLPFENRMRKGEVLYLAIVLIVFLILLNQFTTIPFTELTGITK